MFEAVNKRGFTKHVMRSITITVAFCAKKMVLDRNINTVRANETVVCVTTFNFFSETPLLCFENATNYEHNHTSLPINSDASILRREIWGNVGIGITLLRNAGDLPAIWTKKTTKTGVFQEPLRNHNVMSAESQH